MTGRMPELTVSGTIGRGSINLALRVVDLSLSAPFTLHVISSEALHIFLSRVWKKHAYSMYALLLKPKAGLRSSPAPRATAPSLAAHTRPQGPLRLEELGC